MEKSDLRIIFMGTPEFAVPSLQALVEQDYCVVAVVTQPDRPVGRHGSVLQPSAVKQYAQSKGIPVLQPERMKDPLFIEELQSYRANLQVVVAFRMLPEQVWAMPEYGTFNVHAALLPQYRGAAPINWAIIHGEKTTGVTTFFLDHDIDTGRIILQKPFTIPDDADAEYVYGGLKTLGAELCLQTVDLILQGSGAVASIPQQQLTQSLEPLHDAPKLFKETCRIHWNQPTASVYNFIRGLSPSPGAWSMLSSAAENAQPTVMKIFRTVKTDLAPAGRAGTITADRRHMYVSTADGMLEILDLQMAGKKRMQASSFLNGFPMEGDYALE